MSYPLPAIKVATTGRQRLNVLQLALISFDHFNAESHDMTVQAGFIGVLMKCLQNAITSEQGAKEAEKICSLATMIFRCSKETAIITITSSMKEIVILLIPIIASTCRMEPTDKCSREAVRLWMRLCIHSIPLNDYTDKETLLLLAVRAIRVGTSLKTSIHLSALHFIAQLSKHPDNRVTIMQFPGLIDAIMDRSYNDKCPHVVTECMKIIEGLLCDARNRAEYITRPRSLGILVKQCRSRNTSACHYAVGSLKQLSIEASLRRKMSGPEIMAAIIRLVIIPSPSTPTKRECLQTMSNLICAETAHHFMAYSGLLMELAKVATCSSSEQLKALAARTIKRISTHVHPMDTNHRELFEAIETMSFTKGRLVQLWTARALVEQSLLPGSSFFMVQTPNILSIFIRLAATKNTDVKAAVFEALANLAQEPENAKRISASTNILELLVRTVRERHAESEEASRQAVRAVLLMASNRSSTKRIAKHFGLVSCLSGYGTSSDKDYELKQAALHGVVVLAPLI